MDEAEWVSCQVPAPLLGELHGRLSRTALKKKVRLLICGCCRRAPGLLNKPTYRHAVEVAERYADGLASKEARDAARWASLPSHLLRHGPRPSELARVAACAGTPTGDLRSAADQVTAAVVELQTQARLGSPFRVELAGRWKRVRAEEREMVCDLLHCLFGNPFRPVRLDAAWLTGPVVQVAKVIYEEGRWDELSVLGDALSEAGCDDAGVLEHCRGKGPHTRGCWVCDCLLNKE